MPCPRCVRVGSAGGAYVKSESILNKKHKIKKVVNFQNNNNISDTLASRHSARPLDANPETKSPSPSEMAWDANTKLISQSDENNRFAETIYALGGL